MKKSFVVLSLGILIFFGCSKDSTTDSYTPTCTGTVKSYKTDVAPIVQTYCVSCHNNFATYAQLAASKSKVSSMVVSGQMPKGTSLTTAQKDAIVCWIDNGAPNN